MSIFDDYFDGLDRQAASQAGAVVAGSGIAPDQAAEERRIAKGLNVPTVVVGTDRDFYRSALEQKMTTTALTQAPKTADWLRNPEFAAMSRDDVANLSWFESGINALWRGTISAGPQAYAQHQAIAADRRAKDAQKSFAELVDESRPRLTGPDGDILGTLGPVGGFSAISRWAMSRIGPMLGDDSAYSVEQQVNAATWAERAASIPMSKGAARARDRIAAFKPSGDIGTDMVTLASMVGENPGDFVSFLAQVAAESLPAMSVALGASAITRDPQVAAVVMGGTSYSQESSAEVLKVLQESGHDISTPEGAAAALADEDLVNRAVARGQMRGLVIGALDGLSGGLAGKALANSSVGNFLLQGIAQAGLGGGGEALAQIAVGDEVNIAEVMIEALAEFVTSPAEVAVIGGRRFSESVGRFSKSGQAERTLKAVDERVAQSALKERAPDLFLELMLKQGHGDKEILIPADQLNEYFQSLDVPFDPQVLEDWGIDASAWDAAVLSGSDVGIPVANYQAMISGTDAAGFVQRHGTLDESEMSVAEAEAFNAAWRDAMESEIAEAEAQRAQSAALRADSEQIMDEVSGALVNAGQTAEAARQSAMPIVSFMSTMAEKVGMAPLDLWRRYGVKIQGSAQEQFVRRRGAVDAAINEVRARGRAAPLSRDQAVAAQERAAMDAHPELRLKRPFTEKIKSLGGIAPTISQGGETFKSPAAIELEHLGVTPKTAPGLFRKGGATDLDNIVASEVFTSPVLREDGNGYLDRDAVYQAIADEAAGQKVPYSAEALAALTAIEELRGADDVRGPDGYSGQFDSGTDASRVAALADALGLDLAAMSNDEVARALGEADMMATSAAADGLSYNQNSLDSLAGEILSDWRVSRGVKVGPKASVWRGVSDQSGEGMATYGQGLYVTTSKKTAQSYAGSDGRIVEMSRDDLPQSALRFETVNDYQIWFQRAEKAFGFKSRYDREAAGLVEPDDFIRSFAPDVDGLQIGKGNDAIFVKWSDPRIMYQDDAGKLGSITFPKKGIGTGDTVISLFENADLSTFLHESGHLFLEIYGDIAAMDETPQSVKDDYASIRKWLGVKDGEPIERKHHEKWARGFEAYLMDGRAPSLELQDAFSRFRSWLSRIYESVRSLGVRVSPEIRDVMDRMLASDEAIAEARAMEQSGPLFREQGPAGMSDADWQVYKRYAERAKTEAEDQLRRKVMEKVRREKTKWWRDEKKQMRETVAAEFARRRNFQLVSMLADKVWLPDGNTDVADIRIDQAALVEIAGEGILSELSRSKLGGRRNIYGKDGIHPQQVADMFGFENVQSMIEELQNTPPYKKALIDEVDRRMVEQYGDVLNDGTIEAEAEAALHNSAKEAQDLAELRALNRQLAAAGRPRPQGAGDIRGRAFKARAKAMISAMTVRDASKTGGFLRAERKAAAEAQAALSGVVRGGTASVDQLEKAYAAKERQMLNHHLYRESRDFAEALRKGRNRFRTYDSARVRKAIGSPHIERIDDLLATYDFRQKSERWLTNRESMGEYIDAMVAEGRGNELAIDPAIAGQTGSNHYTRMSVSEFMGLVDTVRNIEHIGRRKNDVITARRQREFGQSVDRIVKNVLKRGRDAISKPRGAADKFFRDTLNLMKTADTLMVQLDGMEEMGAVYDELKRDISFGENAVQRREVELRNRMAAHYAEHYTKDQIKDMKVERLIEGGNGRAWSKLEVVSAILNAGSESSFQRMTDEKAHERNRLSADQAESLAATLDENDWRFIQGIWDMFEDYWPELSEVSKRRTGIVPKRVDPKIMVSAPDFVRGGYYPAKYDPTLSAKAATDEASSFDSANSFGWGSRSEVKAGMTKERAQNSGGRTLRYDLSVALQSMQETIRVIELSEAVDATGRLLANGEVKSAFYDRGLDSEYQTLQLWLKDVASGPVFNNDPMNRLARIGKRNLTSMFLGFNPKTTLLQVTGLAQAAAVIGKRNLASGMIAYLKSPAQSADMVKKASAMMADRQKTMQKDIYDIAMDPGANSLTAGAYGRLRGNIENVGFAPIQMAQFYLVDMPTWMGAYQSHINGGGNHDSAVEYADRMIVRSQDSALMGDRAAIARGTLGQNTRQSDVVRFFTTLGGYMITKLNRGMIEAQRGAKNFGEANTALGKISAAAEMATNMFLLYVAEGLLMGLMYSMMGDDDEPQDLVAYVAEQTGSAIVGGFPILRDAFSFATSGFGAGGMNETIGKIPGDIWKQVAQGENDKAARKALANGVGVVTGLPTTATMRAIEKVIDSDGTSFSEVFFGKNPLEK